jgi:UDP-N-acetylglucosamine transferase subunit ALG13
VILLTVGTQIAFDRLVKAVDDWAVKQGRTDVVAQVGPSNYTCQALKSHKFLSQDEMQRLQMEASVTIAHAGMGSIITALEFGKPIIVMPRDHARGEHRNAHQSGTAARFANHPGIYVANDETELLSYLENIDALVAHTSASDKAPASFVNHLRAFIDGDSGERWKWWQALSIRSGTAGERN